VEIRLIANVRKSVQFREGELEYREYGVLKGMIPPEFGEG
jgi:hypothetical protein